MKNGIYGFASWYYVAMALLCTFTGQVLLVGTILGFVAVMEKDEWLTKQMLQVFTLSVFFTFIMAIIHEFGKIVNLIPFLGSGIMGFVDFIANMILLAIIFGAYRNTKNGQDILIPGIQGLVNAAYGAFSKSAAYTHVTPPTPSTDDSSQEWVCSNCGKQNTGKFCKDCGTGRIN